MVSKEQLAGSFSGLGVLNVSFERELMEVLAEIELERDSDSPRRTEQGRGSSSS